MRVPMVLRPRPLQGNVAQARACPDAAQSQASDKCRHCTGGGGAGTDVTRGQRIGPSAPVPSVPIRSARNCVRPQIATVFACAQLCEVQLAGVCYSGVLAFWPLPR